MFLSSQPCLAFLAISSFMRLCSARAVWIPEELQDDATLWTAEDFVPFPKRAETCGGHSSFSQCGGLFPSDFCCPTNTRCLQLNTSSATTATLCCPAGQDCTNVAPVKCDLALQNATINPTSQLHSQPLTALETCGSECCPMGYICQDGNCHAGASAEVNSSLPSSETTTASSSFVASTIPTGLTVTTTGGTTITPLPSTESHITPAPASSSASFSGESFAAGFVPGIALGALIAGGLIFLCLRRKRSRSQSYVNEKHHSGSDTLTDLGPELDRHPTVHGRSISEPTVAESMAHRTEFLNSTPPQKNFSNGLSGCTMHVQSAANHATMPANQADQTSRNMGWLSRSPFVNQAEPPVPAQPPIPSHLKRGTLSFQISPVRALKKQRSMHSLRRHMTDASTRSNSTRRKRLHPSRSHSTESTETIQVLMDTPRKSPSTTNGFDHRYPFQSSASATGTWKTASSSTNNSDRSTPIEEEPSTYTPTRPGRNSDNHHPGGSVMLSSPYTPSNYPRTGEAGHSSTSNNNNNNNNNNNGGDLLLPDMARDSIWRRTAATTFSEMMEKAGIRRTLLMGPDLK